MPTENPKTPPVVPESELTSPRGAILRAEHPHLSWWLLGALVLILGVLLIAIVLWVRTNPPATPVVPSATRPTIEENNEPESTTAEAVTETLQAMSPSSALPSIAADLDATIMPELASDFATLDALVDAGPAAGE